MGASSALATGSTHHRPLLSAPSQAAIGFSIQTLHKTQSDYRVLEGTAKCIFRRGDAFVSIIEIYAEADHVRGAFALLVGSILARKLDRLGVSRRRFEVLGSSKELVALLFQLTNLR